MPKRPDRREAEETEHRHGGADDEKAERHDGQHRCDKPDQKGCRDPPAPERDARQLGLPRKRDGPAGSACHERDQNQPDHRENDDDAQRAGGGIIHRIVAREIVDQRIVDINAPGASQDEFDFEGFEGPDDAHDRGDHDGRRKDRHGHARQKTPNWLSPATRAASSMRESHTLERRRQHHHLRRDGGRHQMRKNDPTERTAVEQRTAVAEEPVDQAVCYAVMRIRHQYPSLQHRKRRQKEGYPEAEFKCATEGQVGPPKQPGGKKADRQGKRLGDDGQPQRVSDRLQNAAVAEQIPPAVEPQPRGITSRNGHLETSVNYGNDGGGHQHCKADSPDPYQRRTRRFAGGDTSE